MKQLLTTCICCIFLFQAIGQLPFSKIISDANPVPGHRMIKTTDGATVLLSNTSSATIKSPVLHKFDADNNLQWSKVFSFGSNTSGSAIAATPDNGIVMTGFKFGKIDTLVIMKVDSSGNVAWCKYLNTSASVYGACVEQAFNKIIIAGNIVDHGIVLVAINSSGAFIGSRYYYASNGAILSASGITANYAGGATICGSYEDGSTLNPMLLDINGIGQVNWCKRYSGGSGFHAITKTGDNSFAATGDVIENVNRQTDMYVMKFARDGSPLWSRAFGGTGNESGADIIATSDNYLLAAGYGGIKGRLNNIDIYVTKLDLQGGVKWGRLINETTVDTRAYSVLESTDHSVLLYGNIAELTGAEGYFAGAGSMGETCAPSDSLNGVVNIPVSATVVDMNFGSAGAKILDCAVTVSQGTSVTDLCGASVVAAATMQSSSVIQDGFTCRIATNPVQQTANIWYDNHSGSSHAGISIFNSSGVLMHSQQYALANGKSMMNISLSNMPSGIYILQVHVKNNTQTIKVMKQ